MGLARPSFADAMEQYALAAYAHTAHMARERREYLQHKIRVSLSIGDLEAILYGSISEALKDRLQSALHDAQHDYDTRNVDFGDFTED